VQPILLVVFSFLIGSIPFALLIVLVLFKKDVRKFGSGNVGATNASRMFPKRFQLLAFVVIFLLDAGKGYFSAAVLPQMLGLAREPWPAAAGLAAVLGHVFTPYLRTLGGKGVATAIGVFVAIEPVAMAISLAAFGAAYAAKRIVSLASVTLAVVLPLATWLHGKAGDSVLLLTLAVSAVVVIRHSSNIRRLVAGTEK
jgi:glycerol-3-phosphate acyltransferase PlsY